MYKLDATIIQNNDDRSNIEEIKNGTGCVVARVVGREASRREAPCGCVPGSFLCPQALALWDDAHVAYRKWGAGVGPSQRSWQAYKDAMNKYSAHVDAAQKAIDSGDYYYCRTCGKHFPANEVAPGPRCPYCGGDDISW